MAYELELQKSNLEKKKSKNQQKGENEWHY